VGGGHRDQRHLGPQGRGRPQELAHIARCPWRDHAAGPCNYLYAIRRELVAAILELIRCQAGSESVALIELAAFEERGVLSERPCTLIMHRRFFAPPRGLPCVARGPRAKHDEATCCPRHLKAESSAEMVADLS
jgi:hypothetical protein